MYRPPSWQRPEEQPDKYVGLTALQFDLAFFVVLIVAGLAVWILAFDAWMPGSGSDDKPTTSQALSTPVSGQTASTASPLAQSPAPVALAVGSEVSPEGAFRTSAQKFTNDVHSFRGRMDMKITMGDLSLGLGGDFSFETPDKMYMTMDLAGERIEMLVMLPDMYIKMPGKGWYTFDTAALGFDPGAMRQYLDNRGFMNFADQANKLQGLTRVEDEQIDGVTYAHYRGNLNFGDLMSSIPDGLFDAGTLNEVRSALGPVAVDTWLDEDTLLPRRQKVQVTMSGDRLNLKMDITMDFTDYNQPVYIPPRPANAPPLGAVQA